MRSWQTYAKASQSFVELLKKLYQRFRILFCSPPKKLGKLFVRKTVTALILRLDAHEDFNSGLLPSWRPSQNTLEDFFDFFSFHVEHFSTSHVATHKSQTTKSQTTVLEENGDIPCETPRVALVHSHRLALRLRHGTDNPPGMFSTFARIEALDAVECGERACPGRHHSRMPTPPTSTAGMAPSQAAMTPALKSPS